MLPPVSDTPEWFYDLHSIQSLATYMHTVPGRDASKRETVSWKNEYSILRQQVYLIRLRRHRTT
jgi:hypothetical protein